MSLFAGQRDISLFRHLNRELLGEIINQQCSFYKFKLKETEVDVYGEDSTDKYFMGPVILDCLIQRENPGFSETDLGTDFKWNVNFKLFRDNLLDKNRSFSEKYGADLVPEVGDIIYYNNRYFEVHNVRENQMFGGKNPDYPNQPNPLVNDLDKFGSSISIICETHAVNGDKLGLEQRLI